MILPSPLQQLRDLDQSSPRFHKQLSDLLGGREYQGIVSGLQGEVLEWLVGYLDNVLTRASNTASRECLVFLNALRELSDIKEVLPKSCSLSESLLGHVYEGTFNASRVRIRRARMHPGDNLGKAKKTLRQVAIKSKYLKHPNIVPFLGVNMNPLELISDWMPYGDLPGYVGMHPDADRLSLLCDVAKGLDYLHSCNFIHGDLKGSNILLDETNHARITDFGLSMITHDLDLIRNTSADRDSGSRWVAPEILKNLNTRSKEADVFSFAGVAIEIFTGATPFSEIPPPEARSAIRHGERPSRPTHPTLTDGLWSLIQRCWEQGADLRPHALQISCGLGIPTWKRLIGRPLTLDEQDCDSLVADFLSDPDETEIVSVLCGGDAQRFVDIVDELLDGLAPSLRRKCLSILCNICGRHSLLPTSLQIPLRYNPMDTPVDRGGFSDVWKIEDNGREVAVKVLKVYQASNFVKVTRRFCREVMTWKNLQHQNVLPLLGVKMGNNQFEMASEWMAHGNINKFVRKNGEANRFELLKDVTRGLIYMHGEGMIHGDLKGANILIDQHGRARLADFGLVAIVSEMGNPMTSNPSANVGTPGWMSPELFDQYHSDFEDGRRTAASDCYALGMVIYEVLSGLVPFAHYHILIVPQKITEGERPKRPKREWFTDDLWRMLCLCWSPQPMDRPTLRTVSECLERMSPAWKPLPSGDCNVGIEASDETTSTARDPGSSDGDSGGALTVLAAVGGGNTDEDTIRGSKGIRERIKRWGMLASASISLVKVSNWDGTSRDIEQVLVTAFEADDYLDCIKDLKRYNIDPLSYIDNLDKIIAGLATNSDLRRRCIRALSGTCSFYGILPTSHGFAGNLSKPDPQPFASSVTFDFWRLTDEKRQDQVFAVKSLRVWSEGPVEELKEKYYKEVTVSKRLSHPNILSIEGVKPDLFELCMVSRWMEQGNMLQYMRGHPGVDRLQLLIGIVHGISYLHANEIAHGDLKSPNILIDAEGTPRLHDFSNCSFTNNTGLVNPSAPGCTYAIRWSAPERLGVSSPAQGPTKTSDMYSLSMVIVELVTGNVPFPEYTDQHVIVMTAGGERPSRPHSFDAPGISPEVWKIAQKCWNNKANQRPEVDKVLQSLKALVKSVSKPTQVSIFPRRKR